MIHKWIISSILLLKATSSRGEEEHEGKNSINNPILNVFSFVFNYSDSFFTPWIDGQSGFHNVTFENGSMFSGHLQDGFMDGEGTLNLENGDIYR